MKDGWRPEPVIKFLEAPRGFIVYGFLDYVCGSMWIFGRDLSKGRFGDSPNRVT